MSAWTMQGEVNEPSATAVWACRSRFCRQRGPFWTRTHQDAQVDAGKHRARRFLGIWAHDTLVRPSRGQTFIEFLRQVRLSGV